MEGSTVAVRVVAPLAARSTERGAGGSFAVQNGMLVVCQAHNGIYEGVIAGTAVLKIVAL